MAFPIQRPRRLRDHPVFRDLIRETRLTHSDLIMPLFVVGGVRIKKEIPSMPGQFHLSIDSLVSEAEDILNCGIRAILLFGIPESKDELGTEAYRPDGIVQQAIRTLKSKLPELAVIADVCLCEYTSHGHCGKLVNGKVDNDASLELLAKIAVSQAEAGADMVAPSDMMDGRIAKVRNALDSRGFSHIPIMSYSAKYASAFYGPFREAAQSTPQVGDRRGYQMDPGNVRQALLESQLDLEEGADILMVKPALAYLDVVRAVREKFDLPLAAYNVSAEYSMIKAAALKGWIDEKKMVLEILTGIKRAGANLIITYHAKDVAKWLREDSMAASRQLSALH